MNNDKEQVVRFADALSLLVSKGECVPEDRLQVELRISPATFPKLSCNFFRLAVLWGNLTMHSHGYHLHCVLTLRIHSDILVFICKESFNSWVALLCRRTISLVTNTHN